LAEEFEGQVAFIGVSNNDTVADGRAYQSNFDVPYLLAHAPEVWELYGDPFRPTTIVIGSDGVQSARIDGPVTLDGLRAEIEAAL
jgi:hypothetical protein